MGQGSLCRGLGLSSYVSRLLPPVPLPISAPGPSHCGCLWCLAGPWSQAQDRGREVTLKWQFKNVWGLPLCQGCREWVCPSGGWGPWVSMSVYPEGTPMPRSASSLVLWGGEGGGRAGRGYLPVCLFWQLGHPGGRAMRYRICIFCDSTYELNALDICL